MLNRLHIVRFAVVALATLAIVGAFRTPPVEAAPRGSETKGRAYFKSKCKDCHVKGGKGGEVAPLTKTQAQWRTYFQKGTHNGGKEQLNVMLPETQFLDVQVFLVNHAADSPQPETCGK